MRGRQIVQYAAHVRASPPRETGRKAQRWPHLGDVREGVLVGAGDHKELACDGLGAEPAPAGALQATPPSSARTSHNPQQTAPHRPSSRVRYAPQLTGGPHPQARSCMQACKMQRVTRAPARPRCRRSSWSAASPDRQTPCLSRPAAVPLAAPPPTCRNARLHSNTWHAAALARTSTRRGLLDARSLYVLHEHWLLQEARPNRWGVPDGGTSRRECGSSACSCAPSLGTGSSRRWSG